MADRFTELKNNAYQSSQVIGAQLQGVESSLLGAIIALAISAFVSNALGPLVFWIPASFLLMWILLMNSLLRSLISVARTMRPLIPLRLLAILPVPMMWILIRRLLGKSETEQSGLAQIVTGIVGSLSGAGQFQIATALKNVAPLFKSIAAIFSVSFLSLLIYEMGVIGENVAFSIWIPLVSSLLFVSIPIFNNRTITEFEKSKYKLDFTKIRRRGWFRIITVALIYVLTLLVLPIWSFVILHPIATGRLSSDLSMLIAVMSLQWIAILAFMNYFSAGLVRKEMSVAMFHLSNIQNLIEDLPSNQSLPDDAYQKLREEYGEANRYNMTADDSLLLVNYYSLRASPAYLSKLGKQYLIASNRRIHDEF
jgi:hypothetical protein